MKLGLRQKLLVSVFVSAAALAAAQHAMAATIYVNPGDSIQSAVNAASAGDIIVISAGTYTENVTINKALTFRGANFGVSGNATRGAESTINGAFTVASNNITIDGLRFNGGASAVKGESAANAYDNLVIQNNLIQNTTDSAIRLGLGTGGGIGSDNWTISNNKIENITGNALTGMVLFNVTGLTVTNNVVNHDNAGSTGRRGINLDGVQNATVTGNTINMGLVNPTDPTAASTAAPWIIQVSMSDREVSNVNVSNNSVSGAYRGITPLSQRTITDLDISGNTVSNVIQGIVLNTGSTAPQSTGVTFDIDVIGNVITTTTVGTGAFTCGTGCAIYVRDLHDAHPNGPIVFSNLDITGNTIVGGPIQVGGTETFVSGSGTGNGLVNLSGFVNIQGGAGANTEGTFTAPANPGYISQTSGSNIVVGSGATVTGQDDNGNTLTASGGSTVQLGDNTTISGNTLVGAGGSVEGGTTGSPYVITGNTEVQAGGTLGGNGDLSGSLLNGGNVGPGNSPGIINVGSYVGSGGILTMEADLASVAPVAGTTFDQLNIAGNVTGTSTSITLTQVNPGTAVPTTGLGMALVTVGGSVSSNAFTMSQFIANGYTFSLRYRQDYAGTTDGFFLVSGHCQTSGLADVCLVDSTTDLLVPIDAQGGTDTLQLGGATNFSFDLAAVGPVFQNFEALEKTGTSNVTLTGTNTLTGGVTVTGGTLTASGGSAINDASAVSVASGATLALSASETIGSLAGAGSVSMGANNLTTGGNNTSTAFSGAISGAGSVTKVGTGTLTLSGTNTFTGGLLINAGTVATSGTTAIADTNAVSIASGATLSLGGSETIGGLSGAGSVVLGANTLTSGSGAFTGTTAGTGGLTKAGAGTLSTGNLAHTGLTTVSGGTLNVNGSTAGSVLVNSGGTLSGNTAIGGNLTLNAGGALSSGNSPGTTTVAGNFTGGGILNVEVQFSNAAAPVNGTTHDFLNITGNVTGVSTINILAVAPSTPAALTTGNGIELVRVGGTTSAGAFVLGGPVVQGGVQYLLSYLPNYSGSLDGYFLQSTARDEIAGHAAMLASSRTLLARCHRGEERNSAQGAVAGGKRAWAKYGTGSIESGADTGLQMDQDYTCTAGGIDLASGADLRLGLVGGFGSTEVDVTTVAGVSRLDGDLGLIEAQAAYAKDGMFVNLSAGYATTDWTHTGTVSGVKAATVDGLVGSLMVGRQWALGTSWQLGVSGEINYDGTTCSDACILAGVTAEESNWRAGLGAKLAGTMPAFRPFVSVSWSDDLDGGNTVSLGTVSVAADTAASLLGARAGFEANLSEKIGLFADVGMVEGLDTSVSGVDGQAGLRIFW